MKTLKLYVVKRDKDIQRRKKKKAQMAIPPHATLLLCAHVEVFL